jgi:aminoglycoside phosphotransferase (APT) family kinase protein
VTAAPESKAPDRFGADSARRVLARACRVVGIRDDDAELMRLGENALFRVPDRGGMVVRIARRMDYWSDVQNEVNVSRWLNAVGFPAATTLDVEQPIAVDNHPVTFWSFIDGRPGSNEDIAALGSVLRRLHALPPPRDFQLPNEHILGRVRARIESAPIPAPDARFLMSRLVEMEDAVASLNYPLPPGPTHGDAHSENLIIQAPGRPVLIDFERFAWGQPEWDLSMTATEYESAGWWSRAEYEAFVNAYGFDVREWGGGYSTLRSVHEIKMTTWLMQNVNESAEIADEYRARMLTLRGDPAAPQKWRPF